MDKKTRSILSLKYYRQRNAWKRDAVIVVVLFMMVFWYVIDKGEITSLNNVVPEDNRLEPTISDVEQINDTVVVTRVIDGDTVVIETGETVRYIGIDTPELTHKPPDCYAAEALARNRALVEGQPVRLLKDIRDKDRYGRLLRYVYVGDAFVNKVLVDEGYARAFAVPPDLANETDFFQTEQSARGARRGLWGGCEPDRINLWERTTGERAETAEYLATNSQTALEDSPECFCDENFYDCKDFSSRAEAQGLYDCCLAKTSKDVHLIDADVNGLACEQMK